MKKILSILSLTLILTSLSAQTDKTITLDLTPILGDGGDVKSLVVTESDKKEIALAGLQLEQAGKLKNTAIIMTLVGSAFVGMASVNGDVEGMVVLGGLMMVTSIPLNIIGNSKMVRSGRTLKRFE